MNKTKKTSLWKSISMTAAITMASTLGVMSISPSAFANANNQQLANQYLKKNPEASIYMRELDQEYNEKIEKAESPEEKEKIRSERKKEMNAMIKMYASRENRNSEIKQLKSRDYSNAPNSGEPRGLTEAKRLSKMCGRGESVGYTNYFGDPTFYNEKYPLVGKEFADIEAIPVFRTNFLKNLDGMTREFLKNKQILFTSLALIEKRSKAHSGIHIAGGQKEYSDQQLAITKQKHIENSKNLSDDLFRGVHNKLDKFKWKYTKKVWVPDNSPRSGRKGYYKEVEVVKSGSEILAECRFFWANGNTVKDDESRYKNNRYSDYVRKDKRIGIQPGFIVASPVKMNGEPLAKQNLIEHEYSQAVDPQQVSGRKSEFESVFGPNEDEGKSAEEMIKEQFGEEYSGSHGFKTLDNGMKANDGNMGSYQRNRTQEGRDSLNGTLYDDFTKGTESKKIDELNFNDIYQ